MHKTKGILTNNWIGMLVYCTAFTSLFLGLLIYMLWRPVPVRFFHWLDQAGLGSLLNAVRTYNMSYQLIPEWAIFSLPNGLWAFSYSLLMTYIWWGRNTTASSFWLGTIPVVGLGYELSQGLGLLPGTFCLQDLLFCVLGVSAGLYGGRLFQNKQKGLVE